MELEKAIGRGNSRVVARSDQGAIELVWAVLEDPEEPLRSFKQQCDCGGWSQITWILCNSSGRRQ